MAFTLLGMNNMIVAELIEKLQAMPPDAKVFIVNTDTTLGGKWDDEVRDVILNDPSPHRPYANIDLDNWPPAHELY